MALKLGKCRLCLKLGDFYSIFTEDNGVQLAEMATECAKIKIHDGDGLPDKVCSECIAKLSSAYLFKQQCERSDEQLRRNYVPPPGFSVPTSPTRQSSDSGISHQTDISTKPKNGPESSSSWNRKRSLENNHHPGRSSYNPKAAKNTEKRARIESGNDTDEDYTMGSQVSAETDYSDESDKFKCGWCDKTFPSKRSLINHERIHSKEPKRNALVEIPMDSNNGDISLEEDKLPCDRCGKTFKLNIMLKRHQMTCQGVPEEAHGEMTPNEDTNEFICKVCNGKYKTRITLKKHLKNIHGVTDKPRSSVPCLYCHKPFTNHISYTIHFNKCTNQSNISTLVCLVCKRKFGRKATYLAHIKEAHFEADDSDDMNVEDASDSFICHLCNQSVKTQEQLVTHLAKHMSKQMSNCDDIGDDDDDRFTADDATSNYSGASSQTGNLKCKYCDKRFTYKKALLNHMLKHTADDVRIKQEEPDEDAPPDPPDGPGDEPESSEEEDLTCDICDKMFSYKRVLEQHKRTKHNMSSGFKRAPILLKDCDMRCLICDLQLKVGQSLEHNKEHLAAGIKPKNLYTCLACKDTFNSCQLLSAHIKLIHRINSTSPQKFSIDNAADFCEVVVTKTEPLDNVQSHNDIREVPGEVVDGKQALIDLTGFTCPMCSKKMPTLISLKRHVNWHSNVGNNIESKHECFVCKQSFRFKGHYKLHMKTHYLDPNIDPKFLTCDICNRKSKHLRAALMHKNFHKQVRFGNKDYECSICKKIYQDRKVYLSHMAIHYKRGDNLQNVIIGLNSQDGVPDSIGPNQCQHCGKQCDSAASLKCHLTWHNSKSSLYAARYECDICEKVFTNKRRRDIHVRDHYEHENGPYKCHICGKGFTDAEYFRRHVLGHNFDHKSHKKRLAKLKALKAKCPICPRYFIDLPKMIRHLRHQHPDAKMVKHDPDAPPPTLFHCELCAKAFTTERRLRSHQSSHLRKHRFLKCKFCGIKSLSRKSHNVHIKGHLTKKYIDEPLKCPKCPETFTLGYGLHRHLKTAHDFVEDWVADSNDEGDGADGVLQDLQCSICMKVLASKGNFGRHIDFHNMLRCNYCFEYFTSLKFLEGHLAFSCDKRRLVGDTEVHPKKVKCGICYKAFHVQVKLDCHMRTQHGILVKRERSEKEKQIVCDFCFRVFENEDALNAHKVYHRSVGYYGCIYCNKKFGTMTLYRKHKNHHFSQLNVDNPRKCEHCDETFVAFREFIYHMRDEHGDDKEWIVMPKEVSVGECHICHKVFYNVQRHLQLHEQNRCKKCGEYFMSLPDYDNHLCSIESDDDPDDNVQDIRPKYEECTFCFKPITRTSSKLKHDLIHKNSGSISCRFCALKFKTIDAFNIHAFSHRNRKYRGNPLKCRKCDERFIKYGPFIKHMKSAHNFSEKMHYRTTILPEPCVVCGGNFPNLHNHYRAHLLNRCNGCGLYFTSTRVFEAHRCGANGDADEHVFECHADLNELIKQYIPKDELGGHKYYGYDNDEEDKVDEDKVDKGKVDEDKVDEQRYEDIECLDENSQNSQMSNEEVLMPISIQSPIISDVLSLYEGHKNAAEHVEDDSDSVVELIDDDDSTDNRIDNDVITIDDD